MHATAGKLKPIGPYVIGQIVDYVGTPETKLRRYQISQRRWHVVQIEPQQEKRVEKSLEDANFATYVPRIPSKVRIVRERYRTSMRPMLIGYLFAGFDPLAEPWQDIQDMRGVVRLFMIDERPVPLGEWEVQCIREAEARELEGKTRKAPLLAVRVGNFVQVKDGPFAVFFGFVKAVNERHGTAKVEVNIFGRLTPVDLQADQLDVVLDKPAGIGAIIRPQYRRPRSPR